MPSSKAAGQPKITEYNINYSATRRQVARLSTILQIIPHHVEVPPNIEVKRNILYFSVVLSF
jgi:hypothetical protein